LISLISYHTENLHLGELLPPGFQKGSKEISLHMVAMQFIEILSLILSRVPGKALFKKLQKPRETKQEHYFTLVQNI
jgi:hypothetical protein